MVLFYEIAYVRDDITQKKSNTYIEMNFNIVANWHPLIICPCLYYFFVCSKYVLYDLVTTCDVFLMC